MFTGVYQALRDTGKLPGVRIAAERGVNEGVNEEGIVRMYTAVHVEYAKNCKTSSCSPHESVEHTACRGHVSIPRAASATSPTWRFC